MNSKLYYLQVVALAALLSSCAKEQVFEGEVGDEMIPLNIDGSISQVLTKATAQGFVNGDAVGLYAVNYSEGNTVAGNLEASGNQADNVKYVFDESAFKWVPVKNVYYKDINTHVDIYVYYPYQAGISNVSASGFEVQKDQSAAATPTSLSGYEASDWLWGKAINITPSESKVQVPLSHKLSAVQVTLVEGTGFSGDEFDSISKSVILTNTTRKALLNYRTGEATPLGAPQLDGIVMCPQTSGAFRAVVIPQSVAAGTQLFAITLDGVSYSFNQSEDVDYLAGRQLVVNITLNKKTLNGDYELVLGNTSIVDWTEDLNTHGGEARQYFVVNLESAGTLQSTIESAGKNPAKIKNLKVVGVVNDDDFFFMRDQMEILEAINLKECEVVDNNIPGSAFDGKSSLTRFVFPEQITSIGDGAFNNTNLSGALILPNTVEVIGGYAFHRTLISSVQFSGSLTSIGAYAFSECNSLTGDLLLPRGVTTIGRDSFSGTHFSGRLHLPEALCSLDWFSFNYAGNFTGDLVIPDGLTTIPQYAFIGTTFTGRLILSNVTTIKSGAFAYCGFTGHLTIPEGVTEVTGFNDNNFTSVTFPSSLLRIQGGAFSSNNFIEPIEFPENLIYIGPSAFENCNFIPSISLPSTLQTIDGGAFNGVYSLSSIVCGAIEPPTVYGNAFGGVGKDNLTVEVPAQSVKRYQAEPGWSDFNRISAHYDFSLSRSKMRLLNGAKSNTYTLRAPSGLTWSVNPSTLPDWITVTPSSGIGRTDITISVSEMPRTDDYIEVNEGTFNNPSYIELKGRRQDVVFTLDEKDYEITFTVEQFDSDFYDGHVETLQTASEGPGIDIVFTGEGYDAKDIAKSVFHDNAVAGYQHFFDVEPYKTYTNYFNVYAVTAMSDDSGIGNVNTVKDNKFGVYFTQDGLLCERIDDAFAWAKKADAGMDLSKSLVILLLNSSTYEGVTYMYDDGSALAVCPVSTQAYPYDFRGLVQHEAGGHGFGKLGDEYIYHNAFIQTCSCQCCKHPSSFDREHSLGWYKNLSMTSDARLVPWSHLIYNPQYSDYVDIYEGGYMHSRGVFRSEVTSCMNNNIPYYSAISRQAIVERIKQYAGEPFILDDFYANDDDSFGTRAVINYPVDRTYGVDPLFNRGSGRGPVFMGEHPNVK